LLSLEGVSMTSPLWKFAALAVHTKTLAEKELFASGAAFGDFLNFAVDNEALRDVPQSDYDASISVDARKLLHIIICTMLEERNDTRVIYSTYWRDFNIDDLGAEDPEKFFSVRPGDWRYRYTDVFITSGIPGKIDYGWAIGMRKIDPDRDLIGARDKLKRDLIAEAVALGDDQLDSQQAERYNFSDVPPFMCSGKVNLLRDWESGDSALRWGRLDEVYFDGDDSLGFDWTDKENFDDDGYAREDFGMQVFPGPNDHISLREYLTQNDGQELPLVECERTIQVFCIPSFWIGVDYDGYK
jgi:hypothetical protein